MFQREAVNKSTKEKHILCAISFSPNIVQRTICHYNFFSHVGSLGRPQANEHSFISMQYLYVTREMSAN